MDVYGRHIELVHGVYEPTNITGGWHIVVPCGNQRVSCENSFSYHPGRNLRRAPEKMLM
jgi:hypothetical protein